MLRKPGETVQELAARIRQDAVACDFASIKDPLDEVLRTRFICSINNEAVLKALFKVKDSDLTFGKAKTVAMETEDASIPRLPRKRFMEKNQAPYTKFNISRSRWMNTLC